MDDLFEINRQMLGKKICWPLSGGKKRDKIIHLRQQKGGCGHLIEVAVE